MKNEANDQATLSQIRAGKAGNLIILCYAFFR